MVKGSVLTFFRFIFVLLLILIQSCHSVKTTSKTGSPSPLPGASYQHIGLSSGAPYHSPSKYAQALRKNESRHAHLYQAYTDKIGTTSNPNHQAIYDSYAEKSFLSSRKSAEKAEKMEKVAKKLQIDSNFSVKDQPRTRLQAKKLQQNQQAAPTHTDDGDSGATP